MANLKPSDIMGSVRQVLCTAQRLKGYKSCFLTAYQILERLPETIRKQLIGENGQENDAISVVSQAAAMDSGVVTEFLDSSEISITIGEVATKPPHGICGLYRLEEDRGSIIERKLVYERSE